MIHSQVLLPKDFDFDKWESSRKSARWKRHGEDLFSREPPKSCTRFKSKYCREPSMQRISKSANVNDYGCIEEPANWERWRMQVSQGQFLRAAHLRPHSKEILFKCKLLRKVKIEDGNKHLIDGVHYLKEPEATEKIKVKGNKDSPLDLK